MSVFGHPHAWRAIILALGLACFGPAADVSAGTLISANSSAPITRAAEPFGLFTLPVYAGGLQEKWRGLERKLDDERVQLALCDGDRERCVSPAALALLAIIDIGRNREGRGRLGEINRAINLAIRPMSDMAQYGQMDMWSSPLETFASRAGDCEDYAIAKYMALALAGIATEDLRIVIIHDTMHGEDHAVVAARLEGHWLTLDNRRMAMIEDTNMRSYRPLFAIDRSGVLQYVDAQPKTQADIQAETKTKTQTMAGVADRDLAPSVTQTLAARPGLISPVD